MAFIPALPLLRTTSFIPSRCTRASVQTPKVYSVNSAKAEIRNQVDGADDNAETPVKAPTVRAKIRLPVASNPDSATVAPPDAQAVNQSDIAAEIGAESQPESEPEPETEAKWETESEEEEEDEAVVEEAVRLVPLVRDERDILMDGISKAADTLAVGGDIYIAGREFTDCTVLPKLYDAWFAPGHQLAGAMMGAIERAHADGVRQMELQWPCVPNLEEIEAGTRNNQLFGFQVAADLGMDSKQDYPLVKRYLASYANLYWAKRVAATKPFRDVRSYAVRGDSVRTDNVDLGDMLTVVSRRNPPELQDGELAIVIDPRYNDEWFTGARMRTGENKHATVVFLNSEFNETYGLTGPRRGAMKDTKVVYMLKRVTRGYVFYAYPGPWRGYLEKPDCSVEVVKEFEDTPKLGTVARIIREESNRRYGGFNNDRYVRGIGGRL